MTDFAQWLASNEGKPGTTTKAPLAGKAAGALSLLLWIGVIFLGCWIGFTTTANLSPAPDINLDNLFPLMVSALPS